MVEKSFKPDLFTCNILLRGLCTEGMLDNALKLFNTWISKGKAIDAVTYNTIISGLCKEGRFEEAFDLLAEMEEKKLGPDCYTYNAILCALADAGRMEAEEFMSKIVEQGKLQDQTISLNKRKTESGSETAQESDPNSVAFSEQINELCTQGKYKDAMHMVQESTQKGITLHKSTYISLMEGLIKR
eukprot:XP_025015568.1 pentatricopeptide repeat-containing protein At2g16880 [Ricinus communis]